MMKKSKMIPKNSYGDVHFLLLPLLHPHHHLQHFSQRLHFLRLQQYRSAIADASTDPTIHHCDLVELELEPPPRI
jgi:hypothetical protein